MPPPAPARGRIPLNGVKIIAVEEARRVRGGFTGLSVYSSTLRSSRWDRGVLRGFNSSTCKSYGCSCNAVIMVMVVVATRDDAERDRGLNGSGGREVGEQRR